MFRKRKRPASIQSTLVTGGRFKRSNTFLTVTHASDEMEESVLMEGDSESYPAVADDEGISNDDATEETSTAYEKRKQKAANGWNAIRDSLLRTAVETQCIPM